MGRREPAAGMRHLIPAGLRAAAGTYRATGSAL